MEVYWQILIPIVAGFVSAIGGYFSGRKQQTQDENKSSLENLDKSLTIYQTMIDDLSKRLNDYIADAEVKFITYEKKIKEMQVTIDNCNFIINKFAK